MVPPFIKAVKAALEWEDPEPPPKKEKNYYPHLKKQVATFPLMAEIRGLFQEQWQKGERKSSSTNRLQK